QFADLAALAIDSAQLALALTESDEKLRAIVQNTTDFIYIKDMQGRYSMLNPAMASFFGQKADELIGQDDHMLFNVQDAETIRAIDHEVLQTRQLHHYENTLSMNSQAYTLLTTQFPYISSSGELQGIIGISRDITARQKSEQALKD